ncbi:TolC family protein [Ideonella margarita]|uniref:TolC family protein n=1 Tax=Ideonella margarita TaxID=2984191 RepID=A0ABU9C9F0_9BURK
MTLPPFARRTAAATTRAATALAMLALTGCASFSSDGGFGQVAQLTKDRTGQTPVVQRQPEQTQAAAERVAQLLSQPLSADSSVEIALLNNRGLQARYAELGIAEADLVRAGRLANPSLRFGRLSGNSNGHNSVEIDRALVFNVLGLLTLPLAQQLEQQRFEQVQMQAALATVSLATDTRKAFFEAVAAQQLVGYHGQVKDAADASNDLARRMVAAGNFSKLSQMREQAFYADATAQLTRAQHQAVATRERLVRLLGLSSAGANAFTLPARLPDLPNAPAERQDAEQTAMATRLDVLMARRHTEATARALGLTNATRFVNVLQAGYQNKSATGEQRSNGFEIELELPLFDFGSTRTAQAEGTYLQAVHRTAQVAVNARSEVREAYSAYRTAHALALHYRDEVVPLRQRISEENLLRYNGMLISVFDLLADAREQVAGVSAAVEALRDYWTAETQLQAAMTAASAHGEQP